ncbi:hypothetical protein AADZ86_18895 [Colwelliaceae bacterium BS250]
MKIEEVTLSIVLSIASIFGLRYVYSSYYSEIISFRGFVFEMKEEPFMYWILITIGLVISVGFLYIAWFYEDKEE